MRATGGVASSGKVNEFRSLDSLRNDPAGLRLVQRAEFAAACSARFTSPPFTAVASPPGIFRSRTAAICSPPLEPFPTTAADERPRTATSTRPRTRVTKLLLGHAAWTMAPSVSFGSKVKKLL